MPPRSTKQSVVEVDQSEPELDLGDSRPLRADAERNRRLIVEAAETVFAERGLMAGFDEVARAAGVGVGTVYRRFPQRDDLIDALFADRVQAMVALAESAAAIEEPWQALGWFLEQSVAEQAGDRGLAEVLGDGMRGSRRLAQARERMLPAVGDLLARARRAGVVRPDVEILDLAVIGSMLARLSTDADPELWRRYLPIALDGLRQRPDSAPLVGGAAREADLTQLARR
ncbi:TetR/AcrR family transcriptional regulator [Kribbella italica]|uniref:AcrR family transcriptional regulator n=1 Tax=Kribbella italica TaxID=1540520 RepID=A0A7W9JAI1_9ACTN|nr:TetR/AcrR family transcriptional regulator [Kribbella italica]MBB5838299.1 AcrR family transcriptional regulator [Kribbella italica]